MIIGSRQRLSKIVNVLVLKVFTGLEEIKRVKITKSLGVITEENLSWKQQIDRISTKVSKAIGILRRAKPCISDNSMPLLYQAIVLPYSDYCSLVWRNCNQTFRGKIQRLHNRTTRVMTGDSDEVRSKDVLHKLGLKNLNERRKSQIMSYVTKSVRKERPENICNMFKISNNENYSLRNNNVMLSQPKI